MSSQHANDALEIKSIAYFEALQYRNDLLTITTRVHTSLTVHVLQKIVETKIRIRSRRKSENTRFEISYSIVAQSGGTEKNLNMGSNHNNIGVVVVRFWHNLHELDNIFVASCNELAKYFYTGTLAQYIK